MGVTGGALVSIEQQLIEDFLIASTDDDRYNSLYNSLYNTPNKTANPQPNITQCFNSSH
jgi:hypothetical protein